jgi:putative phage-type endonuclease
MEEIKEVVEETRSLFHERRDQGIGGSDAPIICGLAAWKSPMQLWAEKSGLVERSSEGMDRDWLDLGNFIEPFIVEKYQEKTGRKVIRQGRFRKHPTIGFMQCHLDGKVIDPDKGEGVWEAKFINPFMAGEWNEETGELPEKYRAQCQHNMAVTGYKYASIAALIFGKGLVVIEIERDEDYIAALIETETRFWDCVESKTPPEATGADTKFIAKVYKEDPTKTVMLPASIEILDDELQKLNDIVKHSNSRKDEIEATIKQTLGDGVYGILPNGIKFTWKEQKREAFSVASNTFRVLRRTAAPKPKSKGGGIKP